MQTVKWQGDDVTFITETCDKCAPLSAVCTCKGTGKVKTFKWQGDDVTVVTETCDKCANSRDIGVTSTGAMTPATIATPARSRRIASAGPDRPQQRSEYSGRSSVSVVERPLTRIELHPHRDGFIDFPWYQKLLDRALCKVDIRAECPRIDCPHRRKGVSDNARGHTTKHLVSQDEEVLKVISAILSEVTGRDLLSHNLSSERNHLHQVWLEVRCSACDAVACTLHFSGTREKAHLELAEVVFNDKSLPLLYQPRMPTVRDIPSDARLACQTCSLFDDSLLLHDRDTRGRTVAELIDDALLPGGVLDTKLNEKETSQRPKSKQYLRVKVIDPNIPEDAILELWPVGHSSPIHHHGGCAGCVRVLRGGLTLNLFDSIEAPTPLVFTGNDGGMNYRDEAISDILLHAPATTWLNRQNWHTHQVHALPVNNPAIRCAVSIHLYISCMEEFHFNSAGRVGSGRPSNDYIWDLSGKPPLSTDPPDFLSSISFFR